VSIRIIFIFLGGNTQGGFNSNYSSSLEDVLLLPLDVAIRKSVEACGSEELKKKMFGCILLVGGGIRFKGVTRYLHQRLALQVNASQLKSKFEKTMLFIHPFLKSANLLSLMV